jgi:adenylylsulfate kinase-like enzyme
MIIEFIHINECDVVVSLVAPYRWLREEFKEKIGFDNFQEFYVHTTEKRGKEKFHVKNYEQPKTEFLDVDTTKDSPEKSFSKIINKLISLEKINH